MKDDLQQSVDAERTEVKIVTAPHRTAGLQKEGLFRENFARIRWLPVFQVVSIASAPSELSYRGKSISRH